MRNGRWVLCCSQHNRMQCHNYFFLGSPHPNEEAQADSCRTAMTEVHPNNQTFSQTYVFFALYKYSDRSQITLVPSCKAQLRFNETRRYSTWVAEVGQPCSKCSKPVRGRGASARAKVLGIEHPADCHPLLMFE